MRRLSRTDQDPHNLRESMSGIGTPAETLSKFGSPNTGSPSRYGALFARQKQEESNGNNSTASIFGHVGSPLRNSSLHPLASPSLRATKVSGEMSPAFASPPRQSSMSLISQSLAHARISSQATESNENHSPSNHHNSGLQPSSTRHGSLSANPTNRLLSSSSAGGTGRIEEEQGECVFTMEEDEDDHRKRYNGNTWGYSGGKSSPGLGAIGTRRGGGTDGKERWG